MYRKLRSGCVRNFHWGVVGGRAERFKFTVGYPNVLGTLTPKPVHLLPAVFFSYTCSVIGMISRERLKIEVKLLSNANRKSYIPRRLAQQRMTMSDLEHYPHRALSLR